MQQIDLARSAFLFLPLVLLGLLVLPGRATMRMVLAIAVGAIAAFVLPLILDRGTLTYLVSFSTMAGIYAILALGLNSQWGLAGHVNFGIAGFFSVGAFTSALFTTTMPEGALASYSQQAFGLQWPFLAGVVMAGILAAIVGFLISIPVLRLRTRLGNASPSYCHLHNDHSTLITSFPWWTQNSPSPGRREGALSDPGCP